jgi:hypothetical protein
MTYFNRLTLSTLFTIDSRSKVLKEFLETYRVGIVVIQVKDSDI